jgi:hypothetical protein
MDGHAPLTEVNPSRVDGFVEILAGIQFLISDLEREGKVVERGITIWIPRRAQRQCLAPKADGFDDVVNITALLEAGAKGFS